MLAASLRRVAAPCVCFVPWAALASCRPLPQQLLPVSAAGGGRRRCTFFSLLRLIGPSAAAAAAPRRGAGAPSPSPSVTPCPLLSLATSSPDRGKSFKGRGKKRSLHGLGSPFGRAGAKRLRGFVSQQGASASKLSFAVATFPVKKRKRKARRPRQTQNKNNFSAKYCPERSGEHFKSGFCGFKITKPRKTRTKTLESGSKKILDVLY